MDCSVKDLPPFDDADYRIKCFRSSDTSESVVGTGLDGMQWVVPVDDVEDAWLLCYFDSFCQLLDALIERRDNK